MIDLGKYTVTVLSAYGVGTVLLLALVVQSVIAASRARRELKEVEDDA